MDRGATVFRGLFGSSLTMGEEVLAALGMPPEQAADHAARFREHDNKLLRAQHLVYDDDVALRQTSHESRVELMQLFAADCRDGWRRRRAATGVRGDRKSTRLNSSHYCASRMPSS